MKIKNYKNAESGNRNPIVSKISYSAFVMLVFFSTFAYAQPSEIWSSMYSNPNGTGYDYCDKSIVDAEGNTYIAASTRTANTNDDIMLVKYNAAGTRLWTKIYNYSYNGIEQPNDICFDGSGNIYITGTSTRGPGGVYDCIVLKYDQNGNIIWVRRINRTNFADRKCEGVSLVARDGLYIGMSFDYNGASECGIAKYSFTGDSISYTSLGALANYTYRMIKIVKDNSLNIYSVCVGNINPNEENDFIVRKINTNGNITIEWSKTFTGASHMDDAANDIAVGPDGNVFVTGFTGVANQGANVLLLKLGRDDGSTIFQKTYNNAISNQDDGATHIGFDINSNIILGGYTYSSQQAPSSMLLIKYSPAGTQLWVNKHDFAGNRADWLKDMKMDNADNIYLVADLTDYQAQQTSLVTAKFSSAGVMDWFIERTGSNTSQSFRSIHILPDGTLITAGNTETAGVRKSLLIKYGSTIGIEPVSNEIPEKFSLSQNYPNPFNPATNIKMQIPKEGFVKLRVFDVTGKEVALLVNENLNAGEYKVDFNASGLTSGVYFYRIEAAGFTDVKKMILVK
ncbi:MAG: T9SS type A sorting domain-containing protein [Ignavibacteria bacterium]|nr:T9SS type A sorting domain-containing protein [Ignavibacteria bacterium]